MDSVTVKGLEGAANALKGYVVGKIIYMELKTSQESLQVKKYLETHSGRTLEVSKEAIEGKNVLKVVIKT